MTNHITYKYKCICKCVWGESARCLQTGHRCVYFNRIMIYLLFPAGGAAWPRVSATENTFIPVSVFAAQRQKQNKSSGVKKFRQCNRLLRFFFTPSCCTWLIFLIYSAVLSDGCLQAKLWLDSTFGLLRSSIMMWRNSSHINYLFHPAQFLQRVWHLLDELVFLTVKTLSIFSAPRFLFCFSCFHMALSWILMTFRCSSFFFHLQSQRRSLHVSDWKVQMVEKKRCFCSIKGAKPLLDRNSQFGFNHEANLHYSGKICPQVLFPSFSIFNSNLCYNCIYYCFVICKIYIIIRIKMISKIHISR